MSEFFNFANPALLNAPTNQPWTQFLPQQPTNLPCSAPLALHPASSLNSGGSGGCYRIQTVDQEIGKAPAAV
jgi:hypothetical protein